MNRDHIPMALRKSIIKYEGETVFRRLSHFGYFRAFNEYPQNSKFGTVR